jgi:hypothetical protein
MSQAHIWRVNGKAGKVEARVLKKHGLNQSRLPEKAGFLCTEAGCPCLLHIHARCRKESHPEKHTMIQPLPPQSEYPRAVGMNASTRLASEKIRRVDGACAIYKEEIRCTVYLDE